MLYRHQSNTESVIDLAELRREAGVTQVQLAEALATSRGQISRIERQRKRARVRAGVLQTSIGRH
jgi:transcriptional regulator with XRE-family HTH domain